MLWTALGPRPPFALGLPRSAVALCFRFATPLCFRPPGPPRPRDPDPAGRPERRSGALHALFAGREPSSANRGPGVHAPRRPDAPGVRGRGPRLWLTPGRGSRGSIEAHARRPPTAGAGTKLKEETPNTAHVPPPAPTCALPVSSGKGHIAREVAGERPRDDGNLLTGPGRLVPEGGAGVEDRDWCAGAGRLGRLDERTPLSRVKTEKGEDIE